MPTAKTRLESPKAAGFRAKASGEKGYIRRRFRHLFPPISAPSFRNRVLADLWPWSRIEYPGKMRLFNWLMGVEHAETGFAYQSAKTLPAVRYRTIAGKLRVIAGRLLALADEADALADERSRVAPPIRFQKKPRKGSGVDCPPVE